MLELRMQQLLGTCLFVAVLALLSSCAQQGYPCPENGTSLVYDKLTHKAAPVSPGTFGGSNNAYDKSGLLKNKKPYHHNGVK